LNLPGVLFHTKKTNSIHLLPFPYAARRTIGIFRRSPLAIFYGYAWSHRFHDHKVYINVSGPLSQDKREKIFLIVEIPFDKPANFPQGVLINRCLPGTCGNYSVKKR